MATSGPLETVDKALAEIEKHTFTTRQKGMIEGMMASWDDRDDLTDGEEKALFAEFGTNYALGGALYSLIKTAEDSGHDDLIDQQIKQKIQASMARWQTEDPKPSSSYRK